MTQSGSGDNRAHNGYNLVYPQVLPNYKHEPAEIQAAMLNLGSERSAHWFQLLNDHCIGPHNSYFCGDRITLADYLGASYICLGETIGQKFDNYPNVDRWIQTMKSGPNWARIREPFDGWAGSLQDQTFIRVAS